MRKAGIYIHFPFCKSRCNYCDFNTSVGYENCIPDYCASLVKEIKITARECQQEYIIPTIYLGGGTPSYLMADCIEKILQAIGDSFQEAPEVEITLEANPADITFEKWKCWQAAGINRLSIGMQSAQDEELKMLGRRHHFADVEKAVEILKCANMENFNLDLMFGLPYQNLLTWQDSIQKALGLYPSHLSLYALTLTEASPLAKDIQAGIYPPPDDDLAADMYSWVIDELEREGFEQYEISNWARGGARDCRCRHNLIYWHNEDYFGFGASAHSHIDNQRRANINGVHKYIAAVQGTSLQGREERFPWVETYIPLSLSDEIEETAILGLRLVQEGLRDDLFIERFGSSLFTIYEKPIKELTKLGLLEECEEEGSHGIRLTKHGRFLGNQVFMRFLLD